jgi:DNA-directed RNA polymerase subunit RPC12/RpoP
MDTMGKKAKKASEETSKPIQGVETKEACMDKGMILAELEATRVKMAALEALAGDEGMDKDAGKAEMIKCPDCGGKVLKATSYCLKCKKKIGGEKKDDKGEKSEDKDDKKGADKEAKEMPTCAKCSKKHWPFQGCGKKEDKKDDKKEKTAMENIVESLDEIAGTLESQKDYELFKIAYQIDQVSDVLMGKKEAATLESDTDEKYMKEFFKAGMREGDSDEKSYMAAFNTDTTTELKDKYPKGLGKDASAMPYQVKK